MQDRGGKEQRVTLRTALPGQAPLVAVAADRDLTRALSEAKRELIRQIDHHKTARRNQYISAQSVVDMLRTQSPLLAIHFRATSATSRHPLSIVNECPRPSNS